MPPWRQVVMACRAEVVAVVPAVFDELQIPAEQRMEPMRHPNPRRTERIIRAMRIRRRDPTTPRGTGNQDEQVPDQVGAEQFCAVRSYLSTTAMHGISQPDAFTKAASGTTWTPETA